MPSREAELEWLITDYFPVHIETISNILKVLSELILLNLNQVCQSACCGENTCTDGRLPASLFPSATLVLSTVGTDVLKGYVTLDGPLICKAEIQILPAWSKGHPIPLHLSPDHPIELPQILVCSTLVDLAMKKLESFILTRFPSTIRNILDDAICYCKQAMLALENIDLTYPPIVANLDGAPDGLVTSFGVQNARVVATVQIQSSVLHTNANSHTRLHSRSSLVGGHSISNPLENCVRVDSVVPALTAAHEMLLYCTYSLNLLKNELIKAMESP